MKSSQASMPEWLHHAEDWPCGVSEAQLCANWQALYAQVGAADIQRLALLGGQLTDTFAGTFAAGYQAALRGVFDSTLMSGWACLAVSEDRSEDPLPGVGYVESDDGYVLHGYKTWIAQIEQVQHLIVQAKHSNTGERRYFFVDRDCQGLTLTPNPSPRILPDLSQGRAQFEQVAVAAAMPIDHAEVKAFSKLEALCIYGAYLGMCQRWCLDGGELEAQWQKLVGEFLAIDFQQAGALQTAEVSRFSEDIQQHLQQMLALTTKPEHWQRDKGLIEMYRRTFATN